MLLAVFRNYETLLERDEDDIDGIRFGFVLPEFTANFSTEMFQKARETLLCSAARAGGKANSTSSTDLTWPIPST